MHLTTNRLLVVGAMAASAVFLALTSCVGSPSPAREVSGTARRFLCVRWVSSLGWRLRPRLALGHYRFPPHLSMAKEDGSIDRLEVAG